MAANEHKNLSSANRHNPKDFEAATNDTILTKDFGTSSTGTDGNLVWTAKNTIKTTTTQIIGYSTGSKSNYFYRNNLTDGQSPYEMNQDYGNATVGSATFDPQDIFRTANFTAQDDCSLMKMRGWIVGTNTNTMTLAICKVTPVDAATGALTPVLLKEVTVTGVSANALKTIGETSFTVSSIAAGDLVFPMIKNGGSTTIYFNVTLELGYDN